LSYTSIRKLEKKEGARSDDIERKRTLIQGVERLYEKKHVSKRKKENNMIKCIYENNELIVRSKACL